MPLLDATIDHADCGGVFLRSNDIGATPVLTGHGHVSRMLYKLNLVNLKHMRMILRKIFETPSGHSRADRERIGQMERALPRLLSNTRDLTTIPTDEAIDLVLSAPLDLVPLLKYFLVSL
jgi:hypothetical protein